jgi:hypothetical protein
MDTLQAASGRSADKIWFVNRGTVKPYPSGMRFVTETGYKGEIVKECYCTSDNLHYEVRFDGSNYNSIVQHPEIISA